MKNSSRKRQAFRVRPLNVMRAALALLLLALVAPAEAGPGHDNRPPDLGGGQDLKVPAGNELFLHTYGVGVQIYTWTGTSWSFVSPEALLYADPEYHHLVAFHYAGPTWESVSGSLEGVMNFSPVADVG